MSEAFHEDAAAEIQSYEALARDIIRTLPESEWPPWVFTWIRRWTGQDLKPVKWPEDQPGDMTFPQEWLGKWRRLAAGEGLPANYTDDDPYDVEGKQPLYDRLQTNWWELPEDQQRQAIVNAFRSTIISPQLELKWNAIVYQLLMDIPADESDPDVFEQALRSLKRKWDNPGQIGFDTPADDVMDPSQVIPGSRLNPPFWQNVRRLAALGPYAEELRQAAIEDLTLDGSGRTFRQRVLDMQIPGLGPKVASFAWLILQPTTSELATLDLWMMRHLDQRYESPRDAREYLELEQQLQAERDQVYGDQVPLGQYQWAVWDKLRTPGVHQDHSPFRVIDPPNYMEVDWSGPSAIDRAQEKRRMTPYHSIPGQLNLLGKWKRLPSWSLDPRLHRRNPLQRNRNADKSI
jgi:hypothetical protein